MALRRIDHIGIVVGDLGPAIAFFVALGLERQGGGTVEGDWVGRIIGLNDVRAEIAMLQTPDGKMKVELVEFRSPPMEVSGRTAPSNASGYRHVAFAVDDLDATLAGLEAHGGELIGEIQQYEEVYRLCYLRGPEGIIVELAEELGGGGGD